MTAMVAQMGRRSNLQTLVYHLALYVERSEDHRGPKTGLWHSHHSLRTTFDHESRSPALRDLWDDTANRLLDLNEPVTVYNR